LLPFADRIERQPFVSWQKLVGATAELDVTIAPLETDGRFTEAKSALKYFEAGLVEVPIVASPTEDYRLAIRHGESGFLASSEDEWFSCLEELILDAGRRKEMGKIARKDVLTRYTSQAQSEGALAVFRSIFGAV
jgi:glycosyltransferase involved in cell wall biosynthesis